MANMKIKKENLVPCDIPPVGSRVIEVFPNCWLPVGEFHNETPEVIPSGGENYYKCASVDSTTKTWTGYKAEMVNGSYVFEETVTAGLSYRFGYIPQKDFVYNADCSVRLSGLYNIPETGMVFYAPLDGASEVAETGQSMTPTGNVNYTLKDGIPCVSLYNNSRITVEDVSALPFGNSAKTLSVWVWFDQYQWEENIAISYGSEYEMGLRYHNGSLNYFWGRDGYDGGVTQGGITGKWIHLAGTWDGSLGKLYVDGQLIGSSSNAQNTGVGVLMLGSLSRSLPSSSLYLAGCRVYNRALTADEIAVLATEYQPTDR